jgi:hypothetical protein
MPVLKTDTRPNMSDMNGQAAGIDGSRRRRFRRRQTVVVLPLAAPETRTRTPTEDCQEDCQKDYQEDCPFVNCSTPCSVCRAIYSLCLQQPDEAVPGAGLALLLQEHCGVPNGLFGSYVVEEVKKRTAAEEDEARRQALVQLRKQLVTELTDGSITLEQYWDRYYGPAGRPKVYDDDTNDKADVQRRRSQLPAA